jgi:uncharacterized protein (TIGR03435 family)
MCIRRKQIALFAISAALVAGGVVSAQLTQTPPAIEVSSVKPGEPGATAASNHFSRDRFSFANVALMTLIEQSFSLKEYEIVNAPAWLRSDRWTLEAKTTAATTLREKLALLQSVLADRFQLKFHHETRTVAVYALVIAKGGPKLNKPHGDRPPGVQYGRDMMIAWKFDITKLASALSGNLNIPVVDKTALTGSYDFQLMWAPDPFQKDFGDIHEPVGRQEEDPARPEIFTAIRQQIGLQLKPAKGPIDVFVIDHVEKASAN